MKRAKY